MKYQRCTLSSLKTFLKFSWLQLCDKSFLIKFVEISPMPTKTEFVGHFMRNVTQEGLLLKLPNTGIKPDDLFLRLGIIKYESAF